MRVLSRVKEDKAAANTVSFIVIMLFIMTMLISFIDVGLYFNVKNEMQAAAENGARNTAIYGGTQTKIREARKLSRGNLQTPEEATNLAIQDKFKPGGTSSSVSVTDITCGPDKAPAGNEVFCEVKYVYNGLAGRFGLFRLGGTDNTIRGTSVSEVTSD